MSKLLERAPWLALGLAFFISLGIWIRQERSGQKGIQARFQGEAARVEKALRARLQGCEDLLRGAGEFLSAQRVEGALWKRYVDSLQLERAYPAVYGLGYAAHVPGTRLKSYPIKVYPRGERFDYFIVQLVEPLERNAGLVGYDLGSELSARTAAERARDMGSAAITGKMILLDGADRRAFLYFLPVFHENALQGWVFARFRVEELLKGIPPEGLSHIALQAYDGPSMNRESVFYDSGGALSSWQKPNEGALSIVKGFEAGGRTWTLNLTARPGFEATQLAGRRSGGLPAMVLVSIWLLAMVWAFFWARRQARSLARRMTLGLQQRERALSSGPHGIMMVDAAHAEMPIVYVNQAFERITGYAAHEALGRNARFLQGNDRDQKGLQELRKAIREQRECRVLLRNYRKDGTPFWNELTVTPVRNDMGRVIQYVGVQQDVTEREQILRRVTSEAAIIRALAESPSLQEAAPRILRAICESQGWDVGTFWRVDPRTSTLRCMDFWHASEVVVEEFERFNREAAYGRDMGVPGYVWSRGEPVWLEDLLKENSFPEASLAAQAGLVSACGFPVANRRGLQGVLAFYSRRIWPLNKNLLLLMVGTGTQISQYVEREQVETQQKELTILERGLAEFMGEGLVAIDREGTCIYANAAAGRMLGYHVRTLLGQNWHEVAHPPSVAQPCEPSRCPVLLSLQSTQAAYVDEEDPVFWRQDRSALPVAYTTSPIIDHNLIQGVVITFVDASVRRRKEEALRQALRQTPTPSDALIEKIRKLLG